MKINRIQISNVLSFKFYDNIESAPEISFDKGLNIIIGENGSGKSTALEVINFLFKKVFYKQYDVKQELYMRKEQINAAEKKQIIQPLNNTNSYTGFRLEPNWNTENNAQIIRVEIELDEIDSKNIKNLLENLVKLNSHIQQFTSKPLFTSRNSSSAYTLDITLNKSNKTFAVSFNNCSEDFGYEYLTHYNFYKEALTLYNENQSDKIEPLYESFTQIGSYRNYHQFQKSVSLKDNHPSQQIQGIKNAYSAKSLNDNESTEPIIFGLVRLRIAENHFALYPEKLSESEREEKANNQKFMLDINKKLELINLTCRIRLIEPRTWQYSFEFFDTKRNKFIDDINSLSAGQKAIIHLIFEAYGRGSLKGGLVIIDEPEIHLHYQFQNEYLQIIRELNKEQNCQYILVTHSEALINSSTINQVKRFSLNKEGCTEIKAPKLTLNQKMLIKILDNSKSTYAFFSKKVVLVEGETDRYFFRSIIMENNPRHEQEISILYVGGKKSLGSWRALFEAFGLIVYRIADFDYILDVFYKDNIGTKLESDQQISSFKLQNPTFKEKILNAYKDRLFILQEGCLENYLGIQKNDLSQVIEFCNEKLKEFLSSDSGRCKEIVEIINKITAD